MTTTISNEYSNSDYSKMRHVCQWGIRIDESMMVEFLGDGLGVSESEDLDAWIADVCGKYDMSTLDGARRAKAELEKDATGFIGFSIVRPRQAR